MSPRDAFKVGFLRRCVEDGLSSDEIVTRAKEAQDKIADALGVVDALGHIKDVGKGFADSVLRYGAPALLAVPPILGGVAGFGLAKATDIDDTDVNDIKDQELVDAYHHQTNDLKRQHAVREYEKQRRRGRSY